MSTRNVVRSLTCSEREALRRDMAESSAWARAELKRRREEKSKLSVGYYKGNGDAVEPNLK